MHTQALAQQKSLRYFFAPALTNFIKVFVVPFLKKCRRRPTRKRRIAFETIFVGMWPPFNFWVKNFFEKRFWVLFKYDLSFALFSNFRIRLIGRCVVLAVSNVLVTSYVIFWYTKICWSYLIHDTILMVISGPCLMLEMLICKHSWIHSIVTKYHGILIYFWLYNIRVNPNKV